MVVFITCIIVGCCATFGLGFAIWFCLCTAFAFCLCVCVGVLICDFVGVGFVLVLRLLSCCLEVSTCNNSDIVCLFL